MELQCYNDDSYDQPLSDVMKVHLYHKSIQLISDDGLDNQSLPDIMTVHLQHKFNHSFTR
jgi:hypothetical protein